MASSPASPHTLHLLGTWRLDPPHPGGPGVATSARRVLAMLALRGPSTREQVRGTLWPALSESAAASRLRTVLWRLSGSRRSLLAEDRDEVALADGVGIDVDRMRLAASAVQAGDLGTDAAIFQADLLPGWQDDWLLVDRERIRQTRLHALETLAGQFTAQGRYAAALDAALAVVQADPLRESAHRAVVRVHLAEDNLSEAIRQYAASERILREELGVAPSAAMRALFGDAAVTVP